MVEHSARLFLRSYGGLLAFAALLVATALLANFFGLFELTDRAALAAGIRRVQGVRGIAVWFVLAYVVVSGLGLPATPLTLAGGAIFGTALGSALNWTGAVFGATLAHFIASQLGSEGLRRLLGRNANRLDSISEKLTFQTVLRLRLIPVMPFNLLNFAAGLARMPLRTYVPATAIGILPGTIIYTFFSDSLIGGVAGAKSHALLRVFIAGVLLTALTFIPALFRRRKDSAAQATFIIGLLGVLTGNALAPLTLRAQSAGLPHTEAGVAFDHSPFDKLLRQHVVNGLVDYDAFASSDEFTRYLHSLRDASPDALPRTDQLAFWINAYNAYTILLINQHNERQSIRNINKAFGLISLKGPWNERMATVGGTSYTLLEIENEILRKRYAESRIHFAIVCASLGCPPLRGEAYTGGKLDEQLTDQARRFLLHSPEKNRLDVGTRTLFVSPIFGWYEEDFGGSNGSVPRYIAQFYPLGPERDLLMSGAVRMKKTDYDWSLNILKARRP